MSFVKFVSGSNATVYHEISFLRVDVFDVPLYSRNRSRIIRQPQSFIDTFYAYCCSVECVEKSYTKFSG